jgi:hypothetical protein
MAETGRPTKLTPEVEKKIVTAIQAGNYRQVAAAHAGIHRSTFHRWMRDGDPDGADSDNQPFRELRAAVEQAEADAEVHDVTIITRAARTGDWRAAAWLLPRRHPGRWGSHRAAGGSFRPGGASSSTRPDQPLTRTRDMTKLSDRQLRQWRRLDDRTRSD